MRNQFCLTVIGVLGLVGGLCTAETASANPFRQAVAQVADLDVAASQVSMQPVDLWRYKQHNGQWWYYTPSNSWMIHQNGIWTVYDAATYRFNGYPGAFYPGYSSGYRGYYDNGYGYYGKGNNGNHYGQFKAKKGKK